MHLLKKCKWCDDPEPRHYPFQCFENPKRKKYRLPKESKSTFASKMTRQVWFKENPPNPLGYYVCYLCGKWMQPIETTLDHVIPRSRAPHLVHDLSNLKPCCYPCNSKKGSKMLDKL